jgi:hypothetical protein
MKPICRTFTRGLGAYLGFDDRMFDFNKFEHTIRQTQWAIEELRMLTKKKTAER